MGLLTKKRCDVMVVRGTVSSQINCLNGDKNRYVQEFQLYRDVQGKEVKSC